MSKQPSLLSLAEKAMAVGNWPEATRIYKQLAEKEGHPDALVHLSYSEFKEDRYRSARTYALRAAMTKQERTATAIRILTRLRAFNELGVLSDFIQGNRKFLEGSGAQGLQVLSAQLSYMGRQEEALKCLDLALRERPGIAPLLLARAQVKVFLGRFDAAEVDIMECLRLAPSMANAWWTLSGLRKQTFESNHVDRLRALAVVPSIKDVDRAYLNYALHKELDDLGDIKAAAQALDVACKARRKDQKYSASANSQLFAKLKQLELGNPGCDSAGFTPVFIVGMYRSGTTLLEQLLGANPALLNAGELQDMTACMRHATDHYCHGVTDDVTVERASSVDYREVGSLYLKNVAWRLDGQTHMSDKWPPNFINVGFICQALPGAKIIHMQRNAVENCFSNLREMYSGAAPYSYDQIEMADYHRQYQDLMRHWNERLPDRILNLHYDDLVSDTEATIRKAAEFCGLEFTQAMLDPRSSTRSVATASAVQVRNAVTTRSKQKWEPYSEYLQPLIRGLEQ